MTPNEAKHLTALYTQQYQNAADAIATIQLGRATAETGVVLIRNDALKDVALTMLSHVPNDERFFADVSLQDLVQVAGKHLADQARGVGSDIGRGIGPKQMALLGAWGNAYEYLLRYLKTPVGRQS